MDQAAAATLRDIGEARARLAADLDVLQARLPPGEEAARKAAVAGGALAGAGALAALLVVLRRRRAEAAERRRQARATAEEVAKLLAGRDPVTATVEHRMVASRTGPWALLVAVAALGLSVVQYLASREG